MTRPLPGTRLIAFASRWFEPALVSSVFERELTPPASMEHRLGIGAMVPAFIGLSSILGWRDRRSPDRSQDHAITSS